MEIISTQCIWISVLIVMISLKAHTCLLSYMKNVGCPPQLRPLVLGHGSLSLRESCFTFFANTILKDGVFTEFKDETKLGDAANNYERDRIAILSDLNRLECWSRISKVNTTGESLYLKGLRALNTYKMKNLAGQQDK